MGADVAEMIKGLQTHDVTLVKAAADGFHANAADVSGNNVPLNGGTYNADGQTIAEALSTATAPLPPAPVALLTPASQAAPADGGVAPAPTGNDHHGQMVALPAPFERHERFHHQWGFG